MSECRFCHEELSKLPPEANVWRHQTGLCAPSRNEVETCLLEIEEGEKRRALRALDYINAQRKPVYVPKWSAIFAALAVLGALAFMAWKVIEALPRFIEAWH